MSETPFDLALDVRAELGECPVWSVRDRALRFVDIKGRALHRFDPATGDHRTTALPEEMGCFGEAVGGGFIGALRSGIWRLDGDGNPVEKLADNPEDQAKSRFNDGRVDPAGRFVAGTLDEPKAGGQGHLYRYDRQGLVSLVDGLLTSNGVAFAPDGRTLYHADTPRFTVWAYDWSLETGTAMNKRVFIQFDAAAVDRARPDGAAVDAEGCYWTALYEGGRVCRFSPAGRLLAAFPLPARCPTMVAFGGPDLRTLFVTTARGGRPKEELAAQPHAGSLFAMAVDVPGLPEPLFDPTV